MTKLSTSCSHEEEILKAGGAQRTKSLSQQHHGNNTVVLHRQDTLYMPGYTCGGSVQRGSLINTVSVPRHASTSGVQSPECMLRTQHPHQGHMGGDLQQHRYQSRRQHQHGQAQTATATAGHPLVPSSRAISRGQLAQGLLQRRPHAMAPAALNVPHGSYGIRLGTAESVGGPAQHPQPGDSRGDKPTSISPTRGASTRAGAAAAYSHRIAAIVSSQMAESMRRREHGRDSAGGMRPRFASTPGQAGDAGGMQHGTAVSHARTPHQAPGCSFKSSPLYAVSPSGASAAGQAPSSRGLATCSMLWLGSSDTAATRPLTAAMDMSPSTGAGSTGLRVYRLPRNERPPTAPAQAAAGPVPPPPPAPPLAAELSTPTLGSFGHCSRRSRMPTPGGCAQPSLLVPGSSAGAHGGAVECRSRAGVITELREHVLALHYDRQIIADLSSKKHTELTPDGRSMHVGKWLEFKSRLADPEECGSYEEHTWEEEHDVVDIWAGNS